MLQRSRKIALPCSQRRSLFFSSITCVNGLSEFNKHYREKLAQANQNRNHKVIRTWRTHPGGNTFHSSARLLQNVVINEALSQPESELPELELPGPVPYIERTTALLTEEEAKRYLYPLYSRGWEIKSMVADDGFNEQDQQSPFLVGKLTLKGPKSARKFLHELMAIEEQEKHHISFNLWSGKRPVVTVIAQTHSARKYSAPESSEATSDHSTEPGITLRDIRLAVLLENFARDSNFGFSPSGTNEHGRSLPEKHTWEDFLSQYHWKK